MNGPEDGCEDADADGGDDDNGAQNNESPQEPVIDLNTPSAQQGSDDLQECLVFLLVMYFL
jgi:hypothetical protein